MPLCVPTGGTTQSGWAFPVGSIFISVVSTNPTILLGYGIWTAFGTGRVMVGVDITNPSFDTAEKTSGALTVAAAGTNSAPAFTGTALGTHTHGVGTYAISAHSGSAVASHASHTHTYTDVPNHVHVENAQGGTTASTTGTHLMTSAATGGNLRAAGQSTANPTGGVATGTTAGPSASLTHTVTQPDNHTMNGLSAVASAGTPAGTVDAPTFTGNPTSVVQPSIAVYMWKRIA